MDRHKVSVYDRVMEFLCKIDRVGESRQPLMWCVTFLFFFSAILLLNILTPLISDDFAYMFIYGTDRLVSSVGNIYESQVNHYYQWGGRSVVHSIAQLLLLLPSCVADVLNTFVYMGYVYLIYLHIKGRGQSSLSLFILVNLGVWFLQPVLGDTVFWLTGSANYLWGTLFILLLLLPFRLYGGKYIGLPGQILASVGMLILGIVAGWTNENTAGAMLLATILYFIYYRSHKWQVPSWLIAGLVGSLAGFIVMIVAPGNYVRAGESSLDLFTIGYRLFNSTHTLLFYCSPLLLISLLVYVVYYHYPRGEKGHNLKLSLIYSIAAIAAVYAMVLSPTFPRRALFGVVTFLIAGTGILFYNLDFGQKFIRQIRVVVIGFGLFAFLFAYYFAFREIDTFRHISQEREITIKQAKEEGRTSCEFERFSGGIYIHGEDPFSAELMSRYYGMDIRLTAPED